MGHIIREVIVGETTETLIRAIFDARIRQESSDPNLNAVSRAMKIKSLQRLILSFVKRNANGKFELIVPERLLYQQVIIKFNNYTQNHDDSEHTSSFIIEVHDSFERATVIQEVKIGKPLTMIIKAEPE